MANILRGTRREDTVVEKEPRVVDDRTASAHPTTLAARIVWFITSAILAILAIRFLFVLLGANPNNGIADFVYSISEPLVSPFFNLFNYEFVNGTARFEGFTLVAMLIYALIGYGIARLLTINRPARPEL